MRAKITGTGSCLPKKILTNMDLEKMVETSDEWIRTRTGIRERRITDASEAASDLAIEASKRALADAKVSADELDAIFVCTCTPDMAFPSVACLVQAACIGKQLKTKIVEAICRDAGINQTTLVAERGPLGGSRMHRRTGKRRNVPRSDS